MVREVTVGNVTCGAGQPLVLIAGPCVIEDEKTTLDIARQLKAIADDLGGFNL